MQIQVQDLRRPIVYFGLCTTISALLITADAAALFSPDTSSSIGALVRTTSAPPTTTAIAGSTGKIAFLGRTNPDDKNLIVCSENADGSDERCWNVPTNLAQPTSLRWLPNGQQLALVPGSPGPVMIMNADGITCIGRLMVCTRSMWSKMRKTRT